jgi:acetyltransferase-like isoleucine patch superfamily enzyme
MIARIFRRLNWERAKLADKIWWSLTKNIRFLRVFYETRDTEAYVTLKNWFYQKVLGFNRKAYWPVHFRSTVNMHRNIYVGIGSAPGLAPGCYIQGIGKLYIGNYVGIGPNVGILSGTHQIFDVRKYKHEKVIIGDYSWIGMNSVILPGVELGEYTIVQAGSVVKDSFKEGYCVIGGNPAKLIKKFPEESKHLFERYEYEYKYHGYIPKHKFEAYRKKNLWI